MPLQKLRISFESTTSVGTVPNQNPESLETEINTSAVGTSSEKHQQLSRSSEPTNNKLLLVSGGDSQAENQKVAEQIERTEDSLKLGHGASDEKAEIKNLPSASQETKNKPTISEQEVSVTQAIIVPAQPVEEDSSEEEPLALKKKGRKKKTVKKKRNVPSSSDEMSPQKLLSPKKKPRKAVVGTKVKKPLSAKAKKAPARKSSKISNVTDQSNESPSDDVTPTCFNDDVTPIGLAEDVLRASDAENIPPSSESEADPMQRSVNANKSVSFYDVVDVCEFDDQEIDDDDWLSQLEQKKEEVKPQNIAMYSPLNLTVGQKEPAKTKEVGHPKLPAKSKVVSVKTKVETGRKAAKLTKPEQKKNARFVL